MMRRSAVCPALVAAALAVLAPTPARAQPQGEAGAPQASDQEKAIARRAFLRAKELHAARRYREAAAAYLEAYSHFPAPAFLYNVAQVYRLAGDRQAALENYRKYLELEPDGEGSADAREFIAALEGSLAEEHEAGRRGTPPSAPVAEERGSEPIDPGGPMGDRDAGGSPGRGKKIAGTAIGAAGVVALGVAVGFGLRARSASSDLSDYSGPWTPDQQKTYDDGKSAERTMAISAVIGTAGIAAGAILFYLGHRDARRAEARAGDVQLGAAASDEGALFVLRGRF